MAYFYSAHKFGNGEHFGFDVIRTKVSQTELQSSRKSDTVFTQYADSQIPPICLWTMATDWLIGFGKTCSFHKINM